MSTGLSDEPVAGPRPNDGGIEPLTFYGRLKQWFGDYPATVISSSLLLFALLYALWRLAPSIGGNTATNQLLIVLGILLGWVVGLLATPFTEVDRQDFAALQKAIYAFMTGYLLSKVDRFLERILFRDGKEPDQLVWKQAALFTGALVTTALIQFTWRRYAFQKAKTKPATISTERDLGSSEVNEARPAQTTA